MRQEEQGGFWSPLNNLGVREIGFPRTSARACKYLLICCKIENISGLILEVTPNQILLSLQHAWHVLDRPENDARMVLNPK